mmetsp:Transcript_22572/g.40013  ORF Transcript_22572/g.40013 Transcript_22572/m.40013 type:complete len:99 (+) Transcript_22572:38-334(+)
MVRSNIYQYFLKNAPSKEEMMAKIYQHSQNQQGLRKGWQVKAAVWVKKMHIDRGDVKVGFHSRDGRFRVVEDLLPKYNVPDLMNCELKPYVSIEKVSK